MPPPRPVKNNHKNMAAERGSLYFMVRGPQSPKFLDPLLGETDITFPPSPQCQGFSELSTSTNAAMISSNNDKRQSA